MRMCSKVLITSLAALGALNVGLHSARGQSLQPAIFVANNGNLEGSVTSFTVNPDGTLNFVAKFVINVPAPPGSGIGASTNAQAVALSPNGKYLFTGHGTISSLYEQLNFFEVNPDATLTHLGMFSTPDSPIDLDWVTDDYIVVTQTSGLSGPFLLFKHFDPAGPSLTLSSWGSVGGTTFYVAVDRARRYVYGASSTLNQIKAFRLNPSGSLTTLNPALSTGFYPLGIGLSPDGGRIYWTSGISAGGHYVGAASIAETGHLQSWLPAAPYWSDGVSPKQIVISADNKWAFVSHGTDATVRGYAVDQITGDLTPTTAFFDVGAQGHSSNMATMGNLLFVGKKWDSTAYPGQGVYSFTIEKDGSLTPNGGLYSTQGIWPWDIAVWPGVAPPSCPGDLTNDSAVDVDDLLIVLGAWGECKSPCPADIAPPGPPIGDGLVNIDDLLVVLGAWGPCN